MIVLAWPWVLLALPLPRLARAVLPEAQPEGAALRLPLQLALGLDLKDAAQAANRRKRLWRGLAWLAWVLLVIAAARPQWVGDPVQLPLSGRDLLLAVDVSGSMESQDYLWQGHPVDRLSLVKAVAGDFIERRTGDRIGLILFGSRAYLQTPLTYDRSTVKALLEEAVIGLAGRETAIGDAIALAVKRLRDRSEKNRVLILLTDGTNTAGAIDPLEAAELAARAGVRIYTIGIGGGALGVSTPFGVLRRQAGDLDAETLQTIAQKTGGRYFQATDTEGLAAIYRELDRLEPTQQERRTYRPIQSLYPWPAGIALCIVCFLAGFARDVHG